MSVTSLQPLHAARVVDVAERHLDGFGAGLAVFAGRAGQLHDEADRDVAVGGVRDARPSPASAAHGSHVQSTSCSLSIPSQFSLYGHFDLFIFSPLHPGFLQMAPVHAVGRRRTGVNRALDRRAVVPPSRYCCSIYSSKTASSACQTGTDVGDRDRETVERGAAVADMAR